LRVYITLEPFQSHECCPGPNDLALRKTPSENKHIFIYLF
jgi:hypothetical protein